ncbi:hypothetical protein R3I93_020999 [Phoxinus phoxinus]|uniref:Rab11 family-interacting protein 1 n=1 Tax=Phoxinus phoxinus TaxID=58324 RepID=A0AAN9GSA8_9TELE
MSLAEQSQQWYPTSVQVTVLQARGLRIKGKNGTNDAYAIMQVAKDKFSTSVAEKSVAPVWKEEAAFDLPLFHPGNAERCTLQVCVMHRALMGPDKTLGQATVNLLELQDNKSRNKPDWFKLMDKTGKADKDRGEVLLDIQFMRNNMTASTYDLSGQDKSRSRLGKLKDKLKGKKKDGMSDSASAIVPSFGQVLTDSEGEEEPDVTPGAKKKNKLKSLFAPKSGLQRNMSQSMSTLATLPEKDSPISLSRSSGLNVESPEGKKKFKFLKHKRTESSDSKVSQGTGSLGTGMVQGNVCINGSHVYTKAQENRAGSTFSLNSSGHGSMEDLRRGHDQKTSVDSLKNSDLQTQGNSVEEMHRKQEEQRKREAEVRERLEEERRQAEKEEMKLIEREQGKKRLEEEERKRLEREEEKRKLEKQIEERKRIEREEERKRIEREEERKRIEREEEKRKLEKQEEERKRIEREEERKRIEREEERKRMVKEEEKRKLEKQEEERKKIERARENEQKRMEEEEKRKLEKKEVERRIEKEETERKRIEQEEMIRIKKEQERIRQEEEKRGVEERIKEEKRKRMEEEENARKEEDKRRKMEEEERTRLENEKLRKKGEAGKIELERRAEEERRRKENEKVEAEEKRKREEERRMTDEKEAKEQERLRLEKEKVEFEKKKIEERMREEQVRKMAEEEKRKLKEKADQERIRQEKEEMERQRQEKEQRPEVKPRSARLNKSKKAPDEMNSDYTPSSNPFEDLLSVDESSTNPFEQATVPQPEALSRSTKVSAVKPSSSVSGNFFSQASVPNTNPFLDDSDAISRNAESVVSLRNVTERSEKKQRAPMPPQNKVQMEKPEIPPRAPAIPQATQSFQSRASEEGGDSDSCSLQQDKRPAPLLPDVSKNRQEMHNEHADQSTTLHIGEWRTTRFQEKDQMNQGCPVSQDESRTFDADNFKNTSLSHLSQSLPSNRQETNPFISTEVKVNKHNKGPAPKPLLQSTSNTEPNNQAIREVYMTKHAVSLVEDGATSNSCIDQLDESSNQFTGKLVSEEPSTKPESVHSDDLSSRESRQEDLPAKCKLDFLERDITLRSEPIHGICHNENVLPDIGVSKKSRAPLPPANSAATSNLSKVQTKNEPSLRVEAGQGSGHRSLPKAIVSPIDVKSIIVQNNGSEHERTGDTAAFKPCRPHAVKPLSTTDNHPDLRETQDNSRSATITADMQVKMKAPVAKATGPYSQLTNEELMNLLEKQKVQLSQKDSKIGELEQYIDNLLVRVMEENPAILMSLTSMKKSV